MQSDQPPLIVVDTTDLRASLRLSSTAWQQVLALSARGVIRLYIPEVVIRETVRHYKRQADEAIRDVRSGIGPLRLLGIDIESDHVEKIEEDAKSAVAGYEGWLRIKLLRAGVHVLSVPDISHEELLTRDLDGRKPFDNKGRGYRDALIWASITELCRKPGDSDTLILVTNNSTDFCGAGEGTIHPELTSELPGSVTAIRYPNLKSMLADQNWPTDIGEAPEPRVDSPVMRQLRTALIPACVALVGNEITGRHSIDDYSHGIDFDEVPIPEGMDTVTIESIEPKIESLHLDIYDKLEDGTLLASAYVDASVTLDGFMHHADYFADEENIEAYDINWNEHYAWVYIERNVQLRFNTTINADLTHVDELDFDSASTLLAER